MLNTRRLLTAAILVALTASTSTAAAAPNPTRPVPPAKDAGRILWADVFERYMPRVHDGKGRFAAPPRWMRAQLNTIWQNHADTRSGAALFRHPQAHSADHCSVPPCIKARRRHWISALAQAQALRAYFRAWRNGGAAKKPPLTQGKVTRLVNAFDFEIGRGGLKLVAGPHGPHPLQYSFDERTAIFNSHISAVAALREVAISDHPAAADAQRLFTTYSASVRREWVDVSGCRPWAAYQLVKRDDGWVTRRLEDRNHIQVSIDAAEYLKVVDSGEATWEAIRSTLQSQKNRHRLLERESRHCATEETQLKLEPADPCACATRRSVTASAASESMALEVALSSPVVEVGRPVTVRATGSVPGDGYDPTLRAYSVPADVGCEDGSSQSYFISGMDVRRTGFDVVGDATFPGAGSYLVCVVLRADEGKLLRAAAVTVTEGQSPPPPCPPPCPERRR